MEREYMDNPILTEEWLEKLSPEEAKVFNKGYVIALLGILEQFVDTKATLGTAAMGATNKSHFNQLLAKIELIDAYEAHYRKRVKMIEADVAA